MKFSTQCGNGGVSDAVTSELGDRQSSHPVKTLLQSYGKSLEALPGVAYPSFRDNRSTLNSKTGFFKKMAWNDPTTDDSLFQKFCDRSIPITVLRDKATNTGRWPLLRGYVANKSDHRHTVNRNCLTADVMSMVCKRMSPKLRSHKIAYTSKHGLLLGGAIRNIRLFGVPHHNHVTTTALDKQVPACIRNTV